MHFLRLLLFWLSLTAIAPTTVSSAPPNGLSVRSAALVGSSYWPKLTVKSWASSASWVYSIASPFSMTAGTSYPITYGTLGYFVCTGGTSGWLPGAYLIDGKAGAFSTPDGTQNMYHLAQTANDTAGATGGIGYLDSRAPSRNIVFDGNSLTFGTNASARYNYPEQTYRLLGVPWNYSGNFGVGGQTTPEMSSDASSQIDTLIKSGHTNVLVAWEITNDLFWGSNHTTPASPATAIANFKSYCSARRAAGWKVIAVTVLPRSNGDANFESYRATCNAELLNGANIGVNWDVVADIASDPVLGPAANTANTAIYPDGVHLNDAGYGIVAGIVRTAALLLF